MAGQEPSIQWYSINCFSLFWLSLENCLQWPIASWTCTAVLAITSASYPETLVADEDLLGDLKWVLLKLFPSCLYYCLPLKQRKTSILAMTCLPPGSTLRASTKVQQFDNTGAENIPLLFLSRWMRYRLWIISPFIGCHYNFRNFTEYKHCVSVRKCIGARFFIFPSLLSSVPPASHLPSPLGVSVCAANSAEAKSSSVWTSPREVSVGAFGSLCIN